MRCKDPELSIIIPSYNRVGTILQCVESALSNEQDNREVIVVDDGSTDGTVDALRQLGDKIKLICLNHVGACSARNVGLNAASGTSIVFLDSDDYYKSDLPKKLHDLRIGNGVDMAIGVHSLSIDGEIRRVSFLNPNDKRETILEVFSDGWVVQTAAICWSREFITKIGGWNSEVLQWQDVELYMRALLSGATTAVFDEDGAVVREYLDVTRISHKVTENVIQSQLAFMEQLVQLASLRDRPFVANSFYKLARHAFRHGHNSAGRIALKRSRDLGLKHHRGSRRHRTLSLLLGLERKEQLSISIKPIFYG